MPKIQFLGRVLPATSGVTVDIPDLKWKWQEAGIDLMFRVRIGSSVINIECELDKYEPGYSNELYKRASDLARAAVNVVAFSAGLGLSVVIETFIGPDGMPSPIMQHDPRLASLCTAYSLDPARKVDLGRVYELSLTEPPLFRALNDLIEAITIPHVSSVNCGRVIDSIRRMITAPGTLSDKLAWKAMNDSLNISQGYQQLISNTSTGPRHGDPAFVAGNTTEEITRRTWMIMNRFIEYRKRGNTPLSATEFPILT
jgi:hypothetical protein